MGRASNRKKERRTGQQDARANPWQRPMPADHGNPRAVIGGLERQMAQLEALRHQIHAHDQQIASAAQQHHDRSNGHAQHLGRDLEHDPDDDLMARAQAGHIRERRLAEEVHRDVSGRVRDFRPKV